MPSQEKIMNKKQRFNTKAGFTPISIERYIEVHLKSNPDDRQEKK
jgi:hypothetical protein